MTTETQRNGAALRVGWIGAGRMGAAMASRLASAGEDLTVWNRTAAKAEPLADRGLHDRRHDRRPARTATWCSRWSRRPPTSSRCSLGEGGLLAEPRRVPEIVVDCSTVSTESSAAMRAACADRGVDFLAAPVSGNGKVVEAGGLTLVVSGPRTTYERVAHLLDHIGKAVDLRRRGRSRRGW